MLSNITIAPDLADRSYDPELLAQINTVRQTARANNAHLQSVLRGAPYDPISKPLALEDGRAVLELWTNSGNKLPTLLGWLSGMRQEDFLILLGEVWTRIDYVYEFRRELKALMPQKGPPTLLYDARGERSL